ncbi:MAG: TlyA family RNA methyltransferase [Litorimonas sp.]
MRADTYLTENGHYESRARAQAAIKAGLVKANGKTLKKPSDKIPENAIIDAGHEHPWVSRGGIKLSYALEVFDVCVAGKVCLDVGASTGGFTDVLLQNAAAHVYAVDVGHGQIHDRLKENPQMTSMEGQDARNLTHEHFSDLPELIVCDASFISAMKILAIPLSLTADKAGLITLVKPQFEVGRDGIGRGGIVKSEITALAALNDVKNWVAAQGWSVVSTDISPIKGGSGNIEYLLHAQKM